MDGNIFRGLFARLEANRKAALDKQAEAEKDSKELLDLEKAQHSQFRARMEGLRIKCEFFREKTPHGSFEILMGRKVMVERIYVDPEFMDVGVCFVFWDNTGIMRRNRMSIENFSAGCDRSSHWSPTQQITANQGPMITPIY